MTGGLYLLCLCASLLGTGLIDLRHRLVVARAPRAAVAGIGVIAIGLVHFLVWDLAAIAAGHYGIGAGQALSGLVLAPHLPVEELLFIVLLAHTTLVLHALALRALRPRPGTEGGR